MYFLLQSTVCAKIMEKLGQVDVDHTERKVITISQDYFYRELNPAEKIKALKGQYNFDHPGTEMANFEFSSMWFETGSVLN